MRVIIDTNVLISAVLKGRKPREIIEFVSEQANID
jgi:predicted nucleic acid-binding protein